MAWHALDDDDESNNYYYHYLFLAPRFKTTGNQTRTHLERRWNKGLSASITRGEHYYYYKQQHPTYEISASRSACLCKSDARTHIRTYTRAHVRVVVCVCVASLTAIVNYYYRTKIIQIYVVHTILWFSGSSGTMICCTLQFFRFPFSSNMLNVPAETFYDYYIFYYVLFRRYHQQKCRFDFYREDRDVSFLTEIKIRRRWKVALYLVH